jgi:hypothetical protein
MSNLRVKSYNLKSTGSEWRIDWTEGHIHDRIPSAETA